MQVNSQDAPSTSSTTAPGLSWLTYFHSVCHSFRHQIDFATVVTEDSDIFTSCPGKTDVRGKGSQFEAAFNFTRHVALQDEENDNAHVLCIDSDLKGKQKQQTNH